jgi:hypothetical protein
MKKAICLIVVFMSMHVNAYDGWSGEHLIQSVRVYPNSQVLITMTGSSNPKDCSDASYLVLNDADTESGKRQYSAILSAYAAGKNVNLALTGCSGGGTSGYRLIEQVWLK